MREVFTLQNEYDENEFFENPNRKRTNIHSVSPVVGILLILCIFGLFGVVYLIDSRLPTPITIADEVNNKEAFVAERAQADLKLLTDIGPRITGSYENEVLTIDFFKRQLSYIEHFTHVNQKVESDYQVASGSYFLDYKPYGAINAYGNIQNVVVKLAGKNDNASILVNAHFDSVPTSPGGSDDGIMCVTMLEILRKLSKKSKRLEHNIIFLFNGAEETPLQASHGFITQHKWAKNVKTLINLEAAGAGGKEILFQTGPDNPWLINYYKGVPHPYGQAAGEEIFQSNLIPSDTDFRIFRDFGNIFGFDFAFTRNGYRYHTKYDDFHNIPLGSYQHVGDNILSLLENLGNAPELFDSAEKSDEKIVYYDFIGLFMISYTLTTAYIINLIVAIISIIVAFTAFHGFGLGFSMKTVKCLGFSFCGIIGGWIAALLVIGIISIILDSSGYAMSWYGNPWLVFGLFCFPALVSMMGVLILTNKFNKILSISNITQVQLHSTRLFWTMILIISTLMKIRSAYIILIIVLFTLIPFLVIQIFKLEYSVKTWEIIYLIGTIIPTLVCLYMALVVHSLFIPMMGRVGSNKNADLMIGEITAVLTIFATSIFVPLITLVRRPYVVLLTMLTAFLAFFIIVFTPLGFPYSGNKDAPTPQRFWITHTGREFFDENGKLIKRDAGIFVLNMDRNSPRSVMDYVKDFKNAVPPDCDSYFLCGLPIQHSRMVDIIDHSSWIPTNQPIIHEPVGLKLSKKVQTSDTSIKYYFLLTGPDHMRIYFSPKMGFELKGLSLVKEVPSKLVTWKDRKVYFCNYGWGKENTPLNFWIEIVTPKEWKNTTFDIAVSGQNVNERVIVKAKHFDDFLKQFPEWADLMVGLASYKAWSF